jgi:hypothetical protein
MPKNPWVRSWQVPGSNGETWKVSQRADGTFGCSCPAWKFAKAPKPECHHILGVRANPQKEIRPPEIILAMVRGCIPKVRKDGSIEAVLTPLMPIGDGHFAATVAYDLAKFGVPMAYIRERYFFGNSFKTVKAYVERHGRRIYGPRRIRGGFEGFEIVAVDCQL